MQKLFNGIIQFKQNDFLIHKEHFRSISKTQSPHTLFIGCCDSRIDPALITKTLPGELFIIRNIANIVPFYRETEEYVSTTSSIEYALKILNIQNIVVCGHSNCGGCSALWNEKSLSEIPHTKKWLELAKPVREQIENFYEDTTPDPLEREWLTEQYNVIEQMKHLFSYPGVQEKYENKQIRVYGWYYIIETGEIYNYCHEKKTFELIS